MSELPTGTVTFLFTDIEGSTRLLRELGGGYADALAEHRRVLREAFARHGGVEVDTQGDAFFVAFERAADALEAAADGQRGLQGPVRVRMGVHTGEPLVTDEGYIGIDVHRAARIAATGYGGQVLVSQSTRDLAGVDGLRDLGSHRLKDLTAPERIYQLGDGEFPPLKSLNATNLPIAANPLVGRAREVQELTELLRGSTRLVTLTGAGGAGKTRLGLQVAAELVDDFPGGVFFVPLAGVQQPELVPSTIASTIGVRDLAELHDRQALLFVDNFEHLLDAAPTIATLLTAAAETKILVTSRAPLRVEGEREFPLDSLPDADAVALLTERARDVRPDFVPDEATKQICQRLDGLPLALELAASRLRSLESASLLERLDRRLPVLTGGRRDAPERQRTLRATIEWSHDLLAPELRRPFEQLAVFVTFSIEAAEAVTEATFDQIDGLVEASLLKPLGGERFLMLETIREFALEQLEASGEADEVRLRHAEFFTALAQRTNLNMEADGPMRHGLVIPERNNIRAALEWTVATGHDELGLRLAIALENYWVTAADPLEGKRWIEALLSLSVSTAPELHALAIRCLGNCAVMAVGPAAGIELYEQSLAEFRALGDDLRIAIALHRIASNLAGLGDLERARLLNEESLAFYEHTGFRKGQAQCLSLFGDLERHGGAPERALDYYDRSIALCRETGFTWWEKAVLVSQAAAMFALDRPRDGGRAAVDSLGLAHRIGDRNGMIYGVALVARAAVEQDDDELAGRLWGALEAEDERAPVAGWREDRNQMAELVFSRAGAGFEAARAAGRKLTLDEAVAVALR